jgi:hypothetical protein
MKKLTVNSGQVKNIILKSVVPCGTSWKYISEAVAAQFTVKNWLVVRGFLQELLNAKLIARTKDTHNEVYTLVKKETPIQRFKKDRAKALSVKRMASEVVALTKGFTPVLYSVRKYKTLKTQRGIAYTGEILKNGILIGDFENRSDGGNTNLHFISNVEKVAFDKLALAQPHTAKFEISENYLEELITSFEKSKSKRRT